MPKGRHRAEPARQLPARLPRQVARPVAGVGAALLTLAVGLTLWVNSGSAPGSAAVAAAVDKQQDAALAANALSAAQALRTEERVSRDRTFSAGPVTPVTTTREPVPAAVGQKWATTDVTIRSGPSADHDRLGNLKALTRVGITGVTKDGWTQVVTDRRAGWVSSTYLSTSKPTPKATSASPGVSDKPCSISPSVESHLTSNARSVYRAVCAAFGDSVSSFGGYRAGDDGDHGSGRAIDIMVSGERGWVIARYVQAHARDLDVAYVIYQQKIWMVGNPTSRWKTMEDRGSTTANHFDHVHVSVS